MTDPADELTAPERRSWGSGGWRSDYPGSGPIGTDTPANDLM